MANEESEREEILYHGTTQRVAESILKSQSFNEQETFFASLKDLADYFAKRSDSKNPDQGGPAVVKVVLYESDMKLWVKNKVVKKKGFDEGDAPELKDKTQLIFSAQAMEYLNRDMFKDELKILGV